MALTAAQVTVATTETSIAAAVDFGIDLAIRNAGAASIFLGPTDVTTSNGYELTTGSTVEVGLNPGDELFGIVATGTERADVIRS